jgi:hypothetical protein
MVTRIDAVMELMHGRADQHALEPGAEAQRQMRVTELLKISSSRTR